MLQLQRMYEIKHLFVLNLYATSIVSQFNIAIMVFSIRKLEVTITLTKALSWYGTNLLYKP